MSRLFIIEELYKMKMLAAGECLMACHSFPCNGSWPYHLNQEISKALALYMLAALEEPD